LDNSGAEPLITVIILTFNSRDSIAKTISAARQVSEEIVIIDSGSTDGTLEIVGNLGYEPIYRKFTNYADQRNWAIREFGSKEEWQLHLDADEVLDDLAIREIKDAVRDPQGDSGFLLERRTYFMGKPLRFGGTSSWHLRVFKSDAGSCEDRLYDQHFLCSGATRKLHGLLHDLNVGSLGEWTARHNRWSDLESAELSRPAATVTAALKGKLSVDPRERRRFYKGAYYKLPLLLRAALYFLFRYVFQLGFLDGTVGFIYAFLQAFWFRILVDAKLIERERATSSGKAIEGTSS
jgi:glycosyltransferase involved in cell wall biosynthesis